MRITFPLGRELRGAISSALPKVLAISAAAVLLAAVPVLAEHTRWWRQSSFEDFDKGTAKGVALRSDGMLFLAPRFAEFADANLAYLLALRSDSKGNLYAAGGANAKVLRLDASGKATTVFDSSELAAQALVLDAAGNLFVGTSPDGKVYKVTPGGAILRFLRSENEIHLGFGCRQGRDVIRRHGRHGKDFCCRTGWKRPGFLYQRGDAHSIAGTGFQWQRPGGHRTERTCSSHLQSGRSSPRLCAVRNREEGNHGLAAGFER